MSTRDVNLYGSFEDWFLANIDADAARYLRERGASYGIGGLCYYSETVGLFNAFKVEIERLATDDYDKDIWQIAKRCNSRDVTQLINDMVWIAAERLADRFERHFAEQTEEAGNEIEMVIQVGDANEN